VDNQPLREAAAAFLTELPDLCSLAEGIVLSSNIIRDLPAAFAAFDRMIMLFPIVIAWGFSI
jgi:hypothetical protein